MVVPSKAVWGQLTPAPAENGFMSTTQRYMYTKKGAYTYESLCIRSA